MKIIPCDDIPDPPDLSAIYYLRSKNPDLDYYNRRTDRNIGWMTQKEQDQIHRNVKVGISGCGGMGGLTGSIHIRLGVAELRIADPERFDDSNINRQAGAGRYTTGKSKAIETARMMRKISDDVPIAVIPQGICKETADYFVEGCSLIADEIEFWAVGARILLHQTARRYGVPVFNCNTVGLSTHLFLFTPTSQTMEERLGLSLDEAMDLQEKIQSKKASKSEVSRVMESVRKGLVPELPEYCDINSIILNREFTLRRLLNEGRASILPTNPHMCSGFLANHMLIYIWQNLVSDSDITRIIPRIPATPKYLFFDSAHIEPMIRGG
ncbi:ThiF family adenylyltransferase [Candidatus Parcubacteria bacterium]|nr:ThiF family adenylyltransferase [Candidatus Parcubacteria bacterium]